MENNQEKVEVLQGKAIEIKIKISALKEESKEAVAADKWK